MPSHQSAPPSSSGVRKAHLVAIRKGDVLQGYQLRLKDGGPGNSKYFSATKHGGDAKAKSAALAAAKSMGLKIERGRGGSVVGRRSRATKVEPGIRFKWVERTSIAVLNVVATWTDAARRPRHTSYSVERHGLDGALDMAIARRVSAGAPTPNRSTLLRELRRMYRSEGNR